MIIIARRGGTALGPENTLKTMREGVKAGADMLEFDVRATSDGIAVVIHDTTLERTHGINRRVKNLTYEELHHLTAESPVPSLESVLERYFGRVLLCIEPRSDRAAAAASELVARYASTSSDKWDNVLFASFSPTRLLFIRREYPLANLSLLHTNNPFAFVAYQRSLDLTAVGFHRLHTNRLALEIAKKAGIFTYAYTVNRLDSADRLISRGFDGIVTDDPSLF